MTITKRPAKSTRAEDFIGAAPDATGATKRVRKGKKVQISLTITEPMLARIDEQAGKLGQSRAAVINLAIFQALENGLSVRGGI